MISKEGLTHHISAQFNAELEEVRSHLLAMGGLVEKQVNDAVTALIEADSGLAQQVREIDDQINQMERNIDEECLRILARRQPAASDLRLIISISKSVIDLERIGDEATKIARRAIQCAKKAKRRVVTSRFVTLATKCATWSVMRWTRLPVSTPIWRCRWRSTTRSSTANTKPRCVNWPPT
jgi:phosphate transport system regulatory protein PhoU